jgi:cyclic lactone autoinducer peptide
MHKKWVQYLASAVLFVSNLSLSPNSQFFFFQPTPPKRDKKIQ